MSLSVEYSGVAVATHMLYKAALLYAITRWVVPWTVRILGYIDIDIGFFSFSSNSLYPPQTLLGPSSPSSLYSSLKMIEDSLALTTFGDIVERLPGSCETCAVCLDQLRMRDQVRELGNCCHVFHRGCLDRWLDHNSHKTCPLCRAPLLTTATTISSSSPGLSQHQQPSWAVEHLLYLLGDDVLL